jgi:4a-hydroxytetrahydrobiopterin dehydratase
MAPRPLIDQHCQPVSGTPLPADVVADHLARAPGWTLCAGNAPAIERTFTFADFHATMAFVNAAAYIAHREDHHPDLHVSYRQCTVRYSTHSVGGLSLNDFICAAHIDALFS